MCANDERELSQGSGRFEKHHQRVVGDGDAPFIEEPLGDDPYPFLVVNRGGGGAVDAVGIERPKSSQIEPSAAHVPPIVVDHVSMGGSENMHEETADSKARRLKLISWRVERGPLFIL